MLAFENRFYESMFQFKHLKNEHSANTASQNRMISCPEALSVMDLCVPKKLSVAHA